MTLIHKNKLLRVRILSDGWNHEKGGCGTNTRRVTEEGCEEGFNSVQKYKADFKQFLSSFYLSAK